MSPLTVTAQFFLLALTLLVKGDWPCSKEDAIKSFERKVLLNPFPRFDQDPYLNQTKTSLDVINETLHDSSVVCALSYQDSEKKSYILKEFGTKDDAIQSNFIVTHQGRCGVCSSTKDLAVYLSKNLTVPVRKCAMLSVLSSNVAWSCLKQLGFSDECVDVWLYNSKNTRKHCFWTCLSSWIKGEPFNHDDGSLNDCLQCDEDKSGPVFKYFSGRTRRNSGIISSIERPSAEFYNMTHCYF